jgi:hypothetical protein
MGLGYDASLYILAFDHRGSFQKKFFGVAGEPNEEETFRISHAKRVIYEGARRALDEGAEAAFAGVLVDEQFGASIARDAKAMGFRLAMPVEKSGQDEFDFQYAEEFGAHIEAFDPDFSKVLVRYNPESNQDMNVRQAVRLKRLGDWLHEHDRRFLFELLVPPTPEQIEAAGGEETWDSKERPKLMDAAIRELQDDLGHNAPGRARRGRVRGARARRRRRGCRPLVTDRFGRSRVHRVRDRAFDLVGSAEGVRGRQPRTRGGRQADRRQLPAVHRRLQRSIGGFARWR